MTETKPCGKPASFRYTWPGHDPSYACSKHFSGLRKLCQHMGWPLQSVRLAFGHDHTCESVDDVSAPD